MEEIEIQSLLQEAAKRLLSQLNHSNGFTMLGESSLAEAALVVHIGGEFARTGCGVWAESPFLPQKAKSPGRLDLLIDLTAADLSAPSLLLVEAKAAGGGRSKMIREVLADIKRLHAWSSLEILSRPTFFFWSNAADVRGLVAAIFSEKLIQQSDKTFDRRPDSLAAWWETLQGTPKAAAKLIEELESALRPALWRKVVPGPTKDGGTQLFVALALFQCDLPEPNDLRKTAAHEAAHGVVALSQGIPVTKLGLDDDLDFVGKSLIDWCGARGTMPDEDLLKAAAAIGYAGAFVDFRFKAPNEDFQTIMNRLPTDTNRLQEVRKAAIEWGLASDDRDASERYVLPGYELANDLVSARWHDICDLAEALEEQDSLDGDWLANWFEVLPQLEEEDLE